MEKNFFENSELIDLLANADGASQDNPGLSSCGYTIRDKKNQKKILVADGVFLGHHTNNEAEYLALINCLKAILELMSREVRKIRKIEIKMDSTLVVHQFNGRWRVKKEKLRELLNQAKELVKEIRCFCINGLWLSFIPRQYNKEADGLANEVLDEYINKNDVLTETFRQTLM